MPTNGLQCARQIMTACCLLTLLGSTPLQAASNVTSRVLEQLKVIARTENREYQAQLTEGLIEGPASPEKTATIMIENRLLGPEYERIFLCVLGACRHLPPEVKPILPEQVKKHCLDLGDVWTDIALIRVLERTEEDADIAKSLLPVMAEIIPAAGKKGVHQTRYYAEWYIRVSRDVPEANRLCGRYIAGGGAGIRYLDECCKVDGDYNRLFEYDRALGVEPGTLAEPDRIYVDLGVFLRKKTNLTDENRARILRREALMEGSSEETDAENGYDAATVPVMQRLARDPDAKVRQYILGELARTYGIEACRTGSADVFIDVLKNSTNAVEKGHAIDFLRQMLDSPQALTAGTALLSAIGDSHVIQVTDLVRDPSTGDTKRKIIDILARIKEPSLASGVAAVLWATLRHEDDGVSSDAAALLRSRAADFAPTVAAQLRSSDANTVATACDLLVLANPSPTNTVALLTQLAKSNDWFGRLCAVNALAEEGRGSPIASSVISTALGDDSPQVQAAAHRALKKIGVTKATPSRLVRAGHSVAGLTTNSVPASMEKPSPASVSVAVLDFVDTHGFQIDEGTKLSALVFAELSSVSGIRLVERTQIDRILAERGLTAERLVDSAAALNLGRLLSADKLVLGRLYEVDGTIWCNCRLRDSASGALSGCVEKIGRTEDMDPALAGLAARIARRVTENLPAAANDQKTR